MIFLNEIQTAAKLLRFYSLASVHASVAQNVRGRQLRKSTPAEHSCLQAPRSPRASPRKLNLPPPPWPFLAACGGPRPFCTHGSSSFRCGGGLDGCGLSLAREAVPPGTPNQAATTLVVPAEQLQLFWLGTRREVDCQDSRFWQVTIALVNDAGDFKIVLIQF